MKKNIKKVVVFMFMFVFFIGIKSNNVFAYEKEGDLNNKSVVSVENREFGKSVQANKIWTITFNKPVDEKTLKNNVRIIDTSNNQAIDTNISLKSDKKVAIVKSQTMYKHTYILVINNDVTSQTGKRLKKGIDLKFSVVPSDTEKENENKEDKKVTIKAIENVNMNVKQYEKFVLPSTINAVMSNGNMGKVDVYWKEVPNTNTPGKHTYSGVVNGYNKSVILNLNVQAVFKPNVTQKSHSKLQKSVKDYLTNDDNRKSVMKRAIQLHGGIENNTCVYFVSESLRRAGLKDLDSQVCNTLGLTKELKNRGWIVSTDLSELRPGDICFTIAYSKYGPTHAYVFMNWVNDKEHHYAYICDNQGSEYGSAYHKRNIDFQTVTKDKLSYFMYKR